MKHGKWHGKLFQENSRNCSHFNIVIGKQSMLFFFIKSYLCCCLTHAGHIGTDRSLLMGHDVLLLRQIARDLLHASLHRHNDTWTAFLDPVVSTGRNSLIALWQHTTFLKQVDRTGHKPGRTARQTETLPTVLFPLPHPCCISSFYSDVINIFQM